jgi:peptidoglycan/xylan/chitin deacetylase (PgdA/CDA1 family)
MLRDVYQETGMSGIANGFRRAWRSAAGLGLMATLLWVSGLAAQEVALTVDDLPDHGPLPAGVSRVDVTRKMLAALADGKLNGIVYGFINSGKLEKYPDEIEVLKLWREAGQPLGNHTYTHINFTDNPVEAFEENIAKNEPALQQLMQGQDWHWFRYPYLHEGDTVEKRHAARAYLKDHGYRIAQVTLDFEDYLWNGPYARCTDKKDEKAIAWLKESYLKTAREYFELDQQMAQQIYGRRIKYVLLMHIGAFDAEMFPALIAQMRKDGFQFISLPDAESDPAYESDPDVGLKDGGTLLDQFFDSRKLTYPAHEDKPRKELAALCKDSSKPN